MARSSKLVSFMPEAQSRKMMNEPFAAGFPTELAGAVNMMAHPVAGVAAFSALGIGMAGQALGLWIGAVAGVAQASQRMLETLAVDGGGEARASGSQVPSSRMAPKAKKTKH